MIKNQRKARKFLFVCREVGNLSQLDGARLRRHVEVVKGRYCMPETMKASAFCRNAKHFGQKVKTKTTTDDDDCLGKLGKSTTTVHYGQILWSM